MRASLGERHREEAVEAAAVARAHRERQRPELRHHAVADAEEVAERHLDARRRRRRPSTCAGRCGAGTPPRASASVIQMWRTQPGPVDLRQRARLAGLHAARSRRCRRVTSYDDARPRRASRRNGKPPSDDGPIIRVSSPVSPPATRARSAAGRARSSIVARSWGNSAARSSPSARRALTATLRTTV